MATFVGRGVTITVAGVRVDLPGLRGEPVTITGRYDAPSAESLAATQQQQADAAKKREAGGL